MKVIYLVSILFWISSLSAQELFDTSARYSDGKGNYRFERVALHKKIINRYMLKFKSLKKRKIPVVIFMAGGPGSGKSTGLKALAKAGILRMNKFVTIDSDAIKDLLPEYADFKKFNVKRAASLVHNESSYLKDRIFWIGIRQKVNLILDGTLTNFNKYKGVISEVKPLGYAAKIIYVKATVDELIRRVDARAKRTGRMVPHSIVKKSVASIERSVSGLEKMASATFHIDNQVRPKMEKVVFPTGKNIVVNLYLNKIPKRKKKQLRNILEN